MDSSTDPIRIYFIRHGETAWSKSKQHTGHTDIPLTEYGEDEARGLASRLGGIEFSSVLTSPLQRARRTCELAGLAAQATVDDRLIEWDYGDDEGQTTVETRIERPGWQLFRDGGKNGESPAQVSERADQLISELRGLRGNVALFSHGQFGCALVVRWVGLPILDGKSFTLSTASISILSFVSDSDTSPIIAGWNCAKTSPHGAVKRKPTIPLSESNS